MGTKEYLTIEHQTVKHNEEVAKMLKEERIKRHNANMEELKQVTIKGWSDIKGLSIKSIEELDVLNQKVEDSLTLQKQEADQKVGKADHNVSLIGDALKRLQLVPIYMIE